MSIKTGIAVEKFDSGFNCSQSVLYAFADSINLDKNSALKLASGFGAGIGRKQEICGALTGGVVVISAKYGRGEDDDSSNTEKTYEKSRELLDKFLFKYGTLTCLELLNGCNLMTEKGRNYFNEKDLKNKVCKECVSTVVKILDDMI